VSAFKTGNGYVGLPALTYAGTAVDSRDYEGVAVTTDTSAEFCGYVGTGAHGDLFGKVDVSLCELGVCWVGIFGSSEEDADAFDWNLVGSGGHFG
jgi:hypothetical protein